MCTFLWPTRETSRSTLGKFSVFCLSLCFSPSFPPRRTPTCLFLILILYLNISSKHTGVSILYPWSCFFVRRKRGQLFTCEVGAMGAPGWAQWTHGPWGPIGPPGGPMGGRLGTHGPPRGSRGGTHGAHRLWELNR